jgi:hypothetical protein
MKRCKRCGEFFDLTGNFYNHCRQRAKERGRVSWEPKVCTACLWLAIGEMAAGPDCNRAAKEESHE